MTVMYPRARYEYYLTCKSINKSSNINGHICRRRFLWTLLLERLHVWRQASLTITPLSSSTVAGVTFILTLNVLHANCANPKRWMFALKTIVTLTSHDVHRVTKVRTVLMCDSSTRKSCAFSSSSLSSCFYSLLLLFPLIGCTCVACVTSVDKCV